jgi:hypothetical protein
VRWWETPKGEGREIRLSQWIRRLMVTGAGARRSRRQRTWMHCTATLRLLHNDQVVCAAPENQDSGFDGGEVCETERSRRSRARQRADAQAGMRVWLKLGWPTVAGETGAKPAMRWQFAPVGWPVGQGKAQRPAATGGCTTVQYTATQPLSFGGRRWKQNATSP